MKKSELIDKIKGLKSDKGDFSWGISELLAIYIKENNIVDDIDAHIQNEANRMGYRNPMDAILFADVVMLDIINDEVVREEYGKLIK